MHAVLEVGGTHVVAAIVDADRRRVVTSQRVDLDSAGSADAILETFVTAVEGLGSAHRGLPLVVAIPGPFDYARGIGDFDGVAKFGALRGVDLRAFLSDRLGTAVFFVNDVTAFGIGQYELLGRPSRVIALTLGTGVGSCFLDEGRPVEDGPCVPPHGWVYLLEHDGRPIEETFSRRAIVSAYETPSGQRLDVREIAGLARRGDEPACRVLERSFTALADTLAPWVVSFRADLVVIGGSIVGSWDLLERWFTPRLAARLPAGHPPVPVERESGNQDAALIGAAHRFRDPQALQDEPV
ncbi:ROK family protein [Tessaracoccus sp. OS52]|uniref:ROK family protein n=1 Tax=Tessaracoccus sp. OS52 TaxID=2886691 RepID=UPI001D106212|nr:ROK family protein [Tessaracoccus sp. OS52]MCC2591844.1 ROK family protein [Tessaracoccus sp. OS52]